MHLHLHLKGLGKSGNSGQCVTCASDLAGIEEDDRFCGLKAHRVALSDLENLHNRDSRSELENLPD